MSDQATNRLNTGTALLLIAVSLALLVPGIGVSFVDRDEGWYAQVVREMRSTGDWMVPHYLGKIWLGKPPMLYWLVGLSTKLLGWGEWQARLIPVLASIVNVLLVAAFASRLFDRRVGTWAGLIFATCALVTITGKLLITDSLLLTLILLTVMLQYRMATEGVTHKRAALHGIVVGLGILAKGPAILVFGGGFIIALLVAYPGRWWTWLANWRWWAWGMLAFVVAVPWHVYMYRICPETFVSQYLIYEMSSRLADRTQGNQPSFPGFYVIMSLAFLLPWTACVPTALVSAFRSRRENPVYPLILVWLAVPWIFLELLRAKPPNYILPCYVPIAILVAAELVRLFDRTPKWELASPNTRAMLGLMCWPVAILGSLVVMGGFWQYHQMWGLAAGAAGTFTVAGFIVAKDMAPKRGFRAACAAVVAAVVIMHVAFGVLFFPSLEPHRLSRNLAKAINTTAQPGDKVVLCGYKEPTVYVYVDHPVQTVDPGDLGAAIAALPPGEPTVLAITKSVLDKQPPETKSRLSEFLSKASTISGVNHIKRAPDSLFARETVTFRVGRL